MSQELNTTGPSNGFEEIKEIDGNGVEFWRARNLFPLLGYATWQAFDEVVVRAAKAALKSGQIVENHFSQLTKMVDIGSSSKRAVKDWKLDRYACYLIAQNGDSKIPQIAQAQTYFAVQTRRQEIFDKLSDAEKRLFIRGEVTSENKRLFKTARQAGVSNFGLFNDAGYKGLYGSSLAEVEVKKGIKKGELLDRAGSTELAANLFRITQTDEKINKDKIKGDFEARKTHFMVGGKVRQTIKDIGGELPENLKSEKHIKDVKKDIRLLKKGDKLLLKDKKKIKYHD
jgi:DNA-damage-inducible protein D